MFDVLIVVAADMIVLCYCYYDYGYDYGYVTVISFRSSSTSITNVVGVCRCVSMLCE